MPNSEDGNSPANSYLEGFPGRLRELIGSESVRSFSRRCGISETTIRGYLEGKNVPTLEKVILIVEAGGARDATIEWLSTGKTSTTLNINPKSLKTVEMIESLSEDGQREILRRIEALHKADQRDRELTEIKELLQTILKNKAG